MNIPDISNLVLSYVVPPAYRLIEQFDKILGGFNNLDIKSHWYIATNPNPYIIRKVNKLQSFSDSVYLAACYANPNGQQITHLMNNLHVIEFGNLCNIRNPDIIDMIAYKYYKSELENLESQLHFLGCESFGSNPSDVLTCTSLNYLDDYLPNSSDFSKKKELFNGLCKNPNPLAVEYIRNKWYIVRNDLVFLIKATSNPNPIIVQKIAQLINPAQDWSKSTRLIRELSANPSAIEILKTYPECVDFGKLVRENPSPEAAELFIKYIKDISVGYANIHVPNKPIQQIPVGDLLCNPNKSILDLYISKGMSMRKGGSEKVESEISIHLQNPGMFPISKAHTKRKIRLVYNLVAGKN